MRLTELNPRWVGHGGEGHFRRNGAGDLEELPERHQVGITFDCPCGCGERTFTDFENPPDGLGPVDAGGPKWRREGESFEDLTLRPSIQRVFIESVDKPVGACRAHFFVTSGDISMC